MDAIRGRAIGALLALALMASAPAGAAPATPPATLRYHGVLLDALGDPRSGTADLSVRIYDAASGGTLLYKQIFASTPLTDGAFEIAIGPTGEATDTPTNPVTTSLASVFTVDLGGGGLRFAEVTVDLDPAQGRIQILSAPFALRSETAAAADDADVAILAQATAAVNGLSPSVVSEIWEHVALDGGDPPNDDPSEGLADVDLDGIANFVDPDNDGDGLTDVEELAAGSDINLVTPNVAAVTPNQVDFAFPTTVTVTGGAFDPGMTVEIGSQTPTPFNLTPNSFDVIVGPQPAGLVDVTVTFPNSESASLTNGLRFALFTPTVGFVNPPSAVFDEQTPVTVTGTNFEPGITVAFGTQNPTPTNLTPTRFDVTVGPQPGGPVDVTVTRLNGESGTGVGIFTFDPFPFLSHGVLPQLRVFDVTGSGRTVIGQSNDNYYVDTNGDGVPETFVSVIGAGAADFAFDSTGQLWGFHCGGNFPCDLQFANDPNADYVVTPAFVLEANVPGVLLVTALEFAPGDEPVALDARATGGVVEMSAIHDRDGDDLYTGANERELFDTVDNVTSARITADAAARLAMVYDATNGGTNTVRLAHDLNGDGDYEDTVGGVLELRDVHTGAVDCLDMAYDGANRLGVIFAGSGSGTATLLRDLDANGDFLGTSESIALPGAGVTACALSIAGAGGFAAVTNADGDMRLFRDLDLDDTFGGPDEDIFTGHPSTGLAIELDGDGENQIANQSVIVPDL